MVKIDDKDRIILNELIKDSKQTTGRLGKKLNIPITTIHNRIKKLEKTGIIINYTLNVNYKKLGKPIMAYVSATVDYKVDKKINQLSIAKQIKSLEGVKEVTILAGGIDILIKVLAKDIEDLNNMVTIKLRNITGVDKTQTMIILQQV